MDLKEKIKVAELQKVQSDIAPWEHYVTNYDYEKYETYVRSSTLSIYRVYAVGELHFNVNRCSGEVERCNRLVVLKSLGCNSDSLYYTYICDNYALNPPKVGGLVDARLHFIGTDDEDLEIEFYWADSITSINEDVEITFINDYYFF